MTTPRRLGRGLAALLGSEPEGEFPDASASLRLHEPGQAGDPGQGDAAPADFFIHVDEIAENPFQPRREFNEAEIASLAESLREHDMLQPVLVRRVGTQWQLISGERRLRAAIRAGWKKVPARVRDADDRLVAELAIVENLQRKDLNPIEKALSFQRYLKEHQCTQEDLGRRIKIDRSTIANLMRLLELPEEIQNALRSGTLSAGHARALLPLGDARQQNEFCQQILKDQLSVRATEQLVQDAIARDDGLEAKVDPPRSRSRSQNGQNAALAQELRRVLGTKVEIRTTGTGRGRLVIQFRDHEEFERIRQILTEGTLGRT